MNKILRYSTDVRFWYAFVGILMSIIAHELFHLAAHIGHIQTIEIFPNIFTIVEITVDSPALLTHDIEEVIAYTITVLILFITIIDVFAINDSRDRRSVDEILYPKKAKRNY